MTLFCSGAAPGVASRQHPWPPSSARATWRPPPWAWAGARGQQPLTDPDPGPPHSCPRAPSILSRGRSPGSRLRFFRETSDGIGEASGIAGRERPGVRRGPLSGRPVRDRQRRPAPVIVMGSSGERGEEEPVATFWWGGHRGVAFDSAPMASISHPYERAGGQHPGPGPGRPVSHFVLTRTPALFLPCPRMPSTRAHAPAASPPYSSTARGSAKRPRKRIMPLLRSRIANRKG